MAVLVTGATGQVGRHVVARLLDAGRRVRALTRNPGRARLPARVDVVPGDLARPDTLAAALEGVDSLYLFPEPAAAGAVARMARAAGVRRTVVLSSSSVHEAGGGNPSARRHLAVERAVQDAGLDWTLVRPDEFAANALWKWGQAIRAGGVVPLPYPHAARPLIHEADVAAVAVAALLQDGHGGQTYQLTGPEPVSQVEQVRLIGAALGRRIPVEEVTPERGRAELVRFMPEAVVDMVLAYLADAVEAPPAVLATVEKITGRPPYDFARWAADHVRDFR
ncbi:SDR family oxidoreductase [Marinitenerispora sediminis]|uniref:NAD-dependent epimerase n=1 Tax=Marinitenerispora sediminis TaxID=1931232 RepID=A0A368SZ11_9ACTN|nr:NAD(P)H-binding protein [Marinitenerispora sediminis]RCV47762.1 NAD-dependent epimerase [Marinitenerispora sediminis]RCV48320.1 NAD-dependent epimerase [Marinitenerispora sediminis]RCV50077.1 NAD-dependent epimerase [Marinitenerispora sediminis]